MLRSLYVLGWGVSGLR